MQWLEQPSHLRKTINTVQMCVVDKTLVKTPDDEGASAEWRMQMVELFKAKQIAEARKLIVAKARTDEYNDTLYLAVQKY